jgi:hypothetical protein
MHPQQQQQMQQHTARRLEITDIRGLILRARLAPVNITVLGLRLKISIKGIRIFAFPGTPARDTVKSTT